MSFETSFYSVRAKQSFVRSSLKFSYSYKQKFPLSKFMVSKNYCFRKSILFSPFSSKRDPYRFAKISLFVRARPPKLRRHLFYKAELCRCNGKPYKAKAEISGALQRTWTNVLIQRRGLQGLQSGALYVQRTQRLTNSYHAQSSALQAVANPFHLLTKRSFVRRGDLRFAKNVVLTKRSFVRKGEQSFVHAESGEVLKENFTDVFYTNSEVIAFSLFQNFALPFFSISNNFSKNSCFFPDAAPQKYFNSRTKVVSEQSLCLQIKDLYAPRKKLCTPHFKMRYVARKKLGLQSGALYAPPYKAPLCTQNPFRFVKSTLFENPVCTSPVHQRCKQSGALQRTCCFTGGETRFRYKKVRATQRCKQSGALQRTWQGLYRRVRTNRRFVCKERAFVFRFVRKNKARQDTLAKAQCSYKAKNSVQEDRLTCKNLVSLNLKIGDYLSSGDKIGYIRQHDIYRLKQSAQPNMFATASVQRFCSKSNRTKIQKFGVHSATFKIPLIVPFSGRVLTVSKTQLIIQKTQPVLFYDSANLHVKKGEWVKEGTPILTLTHQTLITGDIVQGIPRIEQLFEAFTSPPPGLKERKGITQSKFKNVHDTLHSQVRDIFRKHWLKNVLPIAVRKSLEEIQYNIVEMIQKVYLSQGVLIADKHIEIIIRQMTSKGQILDSGSTGLLLEEVLPIRQIENANITTPGKKCLYVPAVVGLTTAALTCDSFISAASFQETTRVLSRDAVVGKSDFLRGLKEKVVIGDLISAGTGLDIYFIYTLFAECIAG